MLPRPTLWLPSKLASWSQLWCQSQRHVLPHRHRRQNLHRLFLPHQSRLTKPKVINTNNGNYWSSSPAEEVLESAQCHSAGPFIFAKNKKRRRRDTEVRSSTVKNLSTRRFPGRWIDQFRRTRNGSARDRVCFVRSVACGQIAEFSQVFFKFNFTLWSLGNHNF